MLLTMTTDHERVVLKEGAVKLREGKKWKNRWAVLSRQSPVADKCTLDFKKQPKHEKKGEQLTEVIKKSFQLENYVGILTGPEIDGIQHNLVIVLMKNLITLGFTTKYTMRDWELKIRQVFGEEEQFVVKIPHKPFMKIKASDRRNSGGFTANLCLTPTQFALTTMKAPIKTIGVWNLKDVPAYGAVDGGFGFECVIKGRKTLFRLETLDGVAIANAFDVQTGADTEFTRSRFAAPPNPIFTNSGSSGNILENSVTGTGGVGGLTPTNAHPQINTFIPPQLRNTPPTTSVIPNKGGPPLPSQFVVSQQQAPPPGSAPTHAGWSPNITTGPMLDHSPSITGGGRKAHHPDMYSTIPSCSDDHSPPPPTPLRSDISHPHIAHMTSPPSLIPSHEISPPSTLQMSTIGAQASEERRNSNTNKHSSYINHLQTTANSSPHSTLASTAGVAGSLQPGGYPVGSVVAGGVEVSAQATASCMATSTMSSSRTGGAATSTSRKGSSEDYTDIEPFPQPPSPIARWDSCDTRFLQPDFNTNGSHPADMRLAAAHSSDDSDRSRVKYSASSMNTVQRAEWARARLASFWRKCDCGANLNRSCPNLSRDVCKQRKCARKLPVPNATVGSSIHGAATGANISWDPKADRIMSSMEARTHYLQHQLAASRGGAHKRWGSDQHVQYLQTYESQFEEALELCGCDLDQAFSQNDSSSGNETFNLTVLNELRKSIRERGVSSSSTARPRLPSHANSGTITGDSSTTPSTSKHSTPQHRQTIPPMQQDLCDLGGDRQAIDDSSAPHATLGGAVHSNGHIYVNIHYAHIHQPLLSSSASDPRISGSSPNATLNGVGAAYEVNGGGTSAPVAGNTYSTSITSAAILGSRPKQSNGSSSTSFSNQPLDDLRQPRVCLNESNNNSLILHDHHYSQIDKFRPHDKPHHQNTSISNSSNSLISNFNNNNSCGAGGELGGPGLLRQNFPNHCTASASSFASVNNSPNVATASPGTVAVANGNYQKLISTTADAKLSRADLDYLAAPKFAPVVCSAGQNTQNRRQFAGSTGDSMPPSGVPPFNHPDKGGSFGSRDPSPDPDNLSQNLSDSRDEVFVDDDYGIGLSDVVTTVEARVHVRNKSNISYDDIHMQPMLKDSLQTRARKKSASKTTDRPRNGKDYGIPPTRGFGYRSADSFSRYTNLKNVSPEQTQQRRNSCKHEYVNAECIDNVFHIRKDYQRGMHNHADAHKYSTDSSLHSSNSDSPRTSFSPGRDQLGRKKPPYENMMAPSVGSSHKLSSNSAGPTIGSSVHNGAGSESIYHSINFNGKKRGETMSHRSTGQRFFEDGVALPSTPNSKVHLNYIDLSPANAMPASKSVNSAAMANASGSKNPGGTCSVSTSVKPQVSREARTVQYCAIDVESTNILHRCFEEHAKGRKEIYDRQHRPPLASSNKTADNRHNSNSSTGSAGSLPRYVGR